MMSPSAPSPSSSGMSTSSVTMSGSSACTFCSASRPLRAVPTTRNSPEPSMICVDELAHERAVVDDQHADGRRLEDDIALASERTSTRPSQRAGTRCGRSRCRCPRRSRECHALASTLRAAITLRSPIGCPPGGRSAGTCSRRRRSSPRCHIARAEARACARAGAARRSAGTSRDSRVARHRLARQQHVRQPRDARLAIVEHDRDARAESDRGQSTSPCPTA